MAIKHPPQFFPLVLDLVTVDFRILNSLFGKLPVSYRKVTGKLPESYRNNPVACHSRFGNFPKKM